MGGTETRRVFLLFDSFPLDGQFVTSWSRHGWRGDVFFCEHLAKNNVDKSSKEEERNHRRTRTTTCLSARASSWLPNKKKKQKQNLQRAKPGLEALQKRTEKRTQTKWTCHFVPFFSLCSNLMKKRRDEGSRKRIADQNSVIEIKFSVRVRSHDLAPWRHVNDGQWHLIAPIRLSRLCSFQRINFLFFQTLQVNKRFVTSYLNVQGKLYTKIG